jgi:hypothetical protein
MRTIKFRTFKDGQMLFSTGAWNWRWLEDQTIYPIMQFTGLLDKNGKEIYEWDIIVPHVFNVNDYGQRRNSLRLVEWKQTKTYCGFGLGSDLEATEYEVIGNIFENPDLLPMPELTENK